MSPSPGGGAEAPGTPSRRSLPSPYDLLASRPDRSRPFLTGYDGPDVCTELSVATTTNAVAKAAGLLRDELGLEPGDRLSVDLPLHWQLPVWALAGLSCGLVVGRMITQEVDARILGPEGLGDLVAGGPARAQEVLGCACDAFGMPVRGGVPEGVLDVALAVRAHPDVFVPEPAATRRAAVLLPDATGRLVTRGWAELVAEGSDESVGARTWVSAEEGTSAGTLLRRAAVDPVLRAGSVVLARNLSAAEVDRLRTVQGATPARE